MALIHPVVFLRIEDPPNRRRHAQHREIVPGNHFRVHPLRVVVDGDRGGYQTPAEDLGKRLRLLLEILIDRVRMHAVAHVVSVVGAPLIQHHQLVRLLHRQLAQQNLIKQGENRRIAANPQRHREDRHRGEQRTATKRAQSKSKVQRQIGHHLALYVHVSATLAKRCSGRLIACHPTSWSGRPSNPAEPLR